MDREVGEHRKQLNCERHETGFETFVCEHLAENPQQEWFSTLPTEDNPWPDAWCKSCDSLFQREGEWNEQNESTLKARLLCHICYQEQRAKSLKNISR